MKTISLLFAAAVATGVAADDSACAGKMYKACWNAKDCFPQKRSVKTVKVNGKKVRVVTPYKCFAKPATCGAAGTSSLKCGKVVGEACAFTDGNCAAMTNCADTTSAIKCSLMPNCSFDKGYKRGRKVYRKANCYDEQTTCGEATNLAQCNLVDGKSCSYDFKTKACSEITTCEAAKTQAQCDGVGGCTYDTGYKRGKRVIRKPSCAATPATCADATNLNLCGAVDANCQWKGLKCTEVTQCAQTTFMKQCNKVAGCIYTAGKKSKRGKVLQKPSCSEVPVTSAPTAAPFTAKQCTDFASTGKKCKAHTGTNGCTWCGVVGKKSCKPQTDC